MDRKRHLYIVVHAKSFEHGVENAQAALKAGADGIALIDQFCDSRDVADIAERVAPFAPVLINCLSSFWRAGLDANKIGHGCGVWVDSMPTEADLKTTLSRRVPVLCGVGFKHQNESDLEIGYKLAQVEHLSAAGPFICMTSGPKTGSPPDPERIAAYRNLLGHGAPLAIASGISAQNVRQFLPHATHFLVGSSVENADKNVIPDKVCELSHLVRNYRDCF